MTRILVVCEGQTEETFIQDVLALPFAYQNIYLEPRLINTSNSSKGGALNYDRVKMFIINSLKHDKDLLVTTFFDLYGLDMRFPDMEKSQKITNVYQRAELIESSLKADICNTYSDAKNRFFPYMQPYEFEGLLFTEIAKLIELNSEWLRALNKLQAVREAFDSPEHINDSYETRPSKRIADELFRSGLSYRKTTHGPLAIKSIGLDKLCVECKHFAGWYQQLFQLGIA